MNMEIKNENRSLSTSNGVSAGSESPLYQRIAKELRENIRDGIYTEGGRLPTEEALSVRFSVNRHTLRRAIAMLAGEGMLRVDQGRGTFVARAIPDAPIRYPMGARVRYSQSLRDQGVEPAYELLRAVEVPATAELAQKMGCASGDPLALVERLGLADGRPLKVATSYFPIRRFPNILKLIGKATSISQLIQSFGCDHQRKETLVTAQTVTTEDARTLCIALNAPILVTEATNIDETGLVVEYGITRFRGDSMRLVIDAVAE